MIRVAAAAALAMSAAALAGCEGGGLAAPTERGACWHLVTPRDGGPQRFNRVAQNVPTLEDCAARLEAIRMRFSGLGMRQDQLTGAYQGQFLFLRRPGIYTGARIDDRGYLALVRTGDGRLAQPGAVRQPAAN